MRSVQEPGESTRSGESTVGGARPAPAHRKTRLAAAQGIEQAKVRAGASQTDHAAVATAGAQG